MEVTAPPARMLTHLVWALTGLNAAKRVVAEAGLCGPVILFNPRLARSGS